MPLSLGFSGTGDQCQEGFSGWRNLAPRRTGDSDGHVVAALPPNPLVDQVSRNWVSYLYPGKTHRAAVRWVDWGGGQGGGNLWVLPLPSTCWTHSPSLVNESDTEFMEKTYITRAQSTLTVVIVLIFVRSIYFSNMRGGFLINQRHL